MREVVSVWDGDGVFTGRESHTSHDSNEPFKDAAPLIALAAAPLVLVIAVAH